MLRNGITEGCQKATCRHAVVLPDVRVAALKPGLRMALLNRVHDRGNKAQSAMRLGDLVQAGIGDRKMLSESSPGTLDGRGRGSYYAEPPGQMTGSPYGKPAA